MGTETPQEIEIADLSQLPNDAIETTDMRERGTLRRWITPSSLNTYVLRDVALYRSMDDDLSFR